MELNKPLPSEFDLSLKYFRENILNRNIRPNITIDKKDYFIYVNEEQCHEGIEIIYLHLISLDSRKYNFKYPCQKGVPIRNCNTKCKIDHNKNIFNYIIYDRVQCLFRASQLKLIIETIVLNNNYSAMVKRWNIKNRYYFRYQNFTKSIDYLVVMDFTKVNKTFKLITAYPVFDNSMKRQLDKDYNHSLK